MDLNKAIRMAVDSGKVLFGTKSALKKGLNAQVKLVILARNAPDDAKADVKRFCALSQTPLIEYAGTSVELGTVCGKPFPVSALSVVEEGNSDVLKAIKK